MPEGATIIGRVAVKVIPDTSDFRDDAKKALDRAEKSMRPVKIDFEANVDQAVREVHDALVEAERVARDAINIQLNVTEEEKRKLKRAIENIDAEITVGLNEAGLRTTQARLATVSRTRIADIVANVRQDSIAKAEATLAALSGGRAIRGVATDFADWIGNLDRAVPKMAAVSLGVLNLSSYLLTATSNVLTFGASFASIAGVALALPGIFGGLAIGAGATIAVLKDFNDVLPEVGERFRNLQDSMSQGFWDKAEEPFRNFIDDTFPQFARGMEDTSKSLGTFFGNFADSANGILGGSLQGMFDDLAKSIVVSSRYTDSFVGVIEKLGEVGAGYLPRLAEWFGNITQDFDGWLAKQGPEGLTNFIDQGVTALKDLGGVISATGSTFAGLARAAEAGGGATLSTMRETMEGVAEVVNGVQFQDRMSAVFYAAHEGMSLVAERSGPEFQSFMKRLGRTMETVLPSAGRAFGDALGTIFDALDQPQIQRSVEGLFGNIEKAVTNLSPSMAPLAVGLAGVVDVVGALTVSISKSLAPAFETAGNIAADLAPKIIPLVDQLGQLLTSAISISGPALESFGGILGGVADTLTGLLTPINAMINGIRDLGGGAEGALGPLGGIGLTVAAASFLGPAIVSKLATFTGSMRNVTTQTIASSTGLNGAATGASRLTGALKKLGSNGGLMAGGLAGLALSSSIADDQLRTLGLTASGALMGFAMGSPITAAIGAGAGALAGISQAGADAERIFGELDQTLSSTTASFEEKFDAIGKARSEFDKGWDVSGYQLDTFGGRAAYAVNNPIKSLKLGLDQLKSGLSGDGWTNNGLTQAEEDFARMERVLAVQEESWKRYSGTIADAARSAGIEIPKVGASLQEVEAAAASLDPILREIGSSMTELDALSRIANSDNLMFMGGDATAQIAADRLRELNGEIEKYTAGTRSVAGRTEEVGAALDNLGWEANYTKGELDALNQSLTDLFTPGLDAREALRGYYDALEALRNTDASQGFDISAGSIGRDASANADAYLQSLLQVVQTQGELGASSEDLRGIIGRSRQAFIDNAVAAGFSATEAAAYADTINLTPELVATVFEESGLDGISDKIRGVGDQAISLQNLRPNLGGVAKSAAATLNPLVKYVRDIGAKSGKGLTTGLTNNSSASGASSRLQSGVNGLSGIMYSAGSKMGSQLSAGMAAGIQASARAAASAAATMAASAASAARAALGIASPSRVMKVVGGFFAQGMEVGIKAKTANVVKAVTEMSASIIAAAEKTLGNSSYVGGFMSQVQNVWKDLGEKFSGSYRNKQLSNMFGDDLGNLSTATKLAEAMAEQLTDARQELASLTSEVENFRESIVDGYTSMANPVSGGAKTFDGIIKGMQQARDRATEFTASMQQLQKMGLDNTTLEQLAAAGPEAGLATVRALLQGGQAGLAQVAALQQQIASQGAQFAASAGDQVYGPALVAAQNGVKQLTASLGTLQTQIVNYANALLNAMNTQLASSTITAALANIKGANQLLQAVQAAQATSSTVAASANTMAAARANSAGVASSSGGTTINNRTLVYNAAPGQSISSEEDLFAAIGKAF
ncbi:hypothetical protein [Nocardioides alkalitolerans]|uniref:hypothetical protein n=1 Tax=Nocardioides alkalitolerans TaxID=281714 RepID=UPI0004219102|nr:hypothetical protein [Nocardioides alkalitolerans]